jgi:hypothetical protein
VAHCGGRLRRAFSGNLEDLDVTTDSGLGKVDGIAVNRDESRIL